MNTNKKQKTTNKSSQQKGFFAAHSLCPANPAEPRAAKPHLHFVRSLSPLQVRFANAPPTAQATIVLPAFARSLSADGKEKL